MTVEMMMSCLMDVQTLRLKVWLKNPANPTRALEIHLQDIILVTSGRILNPTTSQLKMVYYFTSNSVTPSAFIYVGKDKVESK